VSSIEETASAPPPTLAGYVRIIRRRKWFVLPALVLAPVLAVVVSLSQRPAYQASAGVLLSLQRTTGVTDSSPPSQPEDPARVVQNQAQVARAVPVAQRVVRATGDAFPSAASLLSSSSVSTSTGSDVLTFSVRHGNARTASRVANQYAREFIVYLQNFETSSVTRALAQVRRRLAEMKARKPANRVVYDALGTKEQELEILEALETPTASLVHAATGATQVQPRLVRNIVLGLGLGLLLGIGSAFLSDALDGRIRSAEEIAELLGLPLLGRVSPRRGRLGSGLALLDDPDAKEAEAFRTLRAGLETVARSRGVHSIMVTSALDGDGRSTTVANLAVALARAGRHVLLVDFDFRYPSLDRLFGLEGRPGVTDVMLGHWPLEEAIAELPVTRLDGANELGANWPSTNGSSRKGRSRGKASSGSLRVLPAGPVSPALRESLVSPAGERLLELLRERTELLLVDVPPILTVGDADAFAGHMDALLVVVKSSVVEASMLKELRRRLEISGADPVGFVLVEEESDRGEEAYASPQRPRRRQARQRLTVP
jgi:polysaccharide biosynthesis transport protein